jgi:transcriptional regulator
MYMPDLFAVTDPEEIELVLASLPLGCLVTRDVGGFFATHAPMVFDPAGRVLQGHVTRANPHPERSGDGEALAIFQGPNAYISPGWYPSKREHGRAVPTWNYEVAHVSGKLAWRTDIDWLRDHLTRLSDRFEAGRPEPWALTDAPEDYLQKQFTGIVGFELEVRDVQVKRKLSQNRSPDDRRAVIAALLESDTPADRQVGAIMADGVRPYAGGVRSPDRRE